MQSYILTGIRMGPFIRLMREHGFTPSPGNIGRMIFIFQNSIWSSFFAWRERKTWQQELEKYPFPEDPVIIIGHWRTGSTLLHHLLAADPRFIAPSLFQVTFPEGFLVSSRYFRPVMGRLVKKRPMDNVRLGFDDPQEDEFALLKLTGESPLLKVVFPAQDGYFMNDAEDVHAIPAPGSREHWKKQFLAFCRKICLDSGRTLLLKNPVHSLRVPLLLETFPGARFIHIHRNPYRVVSSSLHLWKVMARDNLLKGRPYIPSPEEVTDGLKKFYVTIERDCRKLGRDRYCEVGFEALESDPAGEIKKIYEYLGLGFSGDTEKNIRSYLEGIGQFRKNSYTFGEDERRMVRQKLSEEFERYRYPE